MACGWLVVISTVDVVTQFLFFFFYTFFLALLTSAVDDVLRGTRSKPLQTTQPSQIYLHTVSMSAPHIPNLNTFRKGNERAPPRGRGDQIASGGGHEDGGLTKDEVVQQTDNDASGSRLSAVEVGYLHDPFARAITRNGGPRRFPLINRGMALFSFSPLPPNYHHHTTS